MRCHFEFSPQTLSELMRPVKCLSYLSVQNNSNQAGIAAVFVTLLRLETEKTTTTTTNKQANDEYKTNFTSLLCGRSRALNISLIKIRNFYSPILCNFTWGFQQISSMTRCRSISSSYWTIVVLKTLNISSAAAVSRSLTNSLKLSTELILL